MVETRTMATQLERPANLSVPPSFLLSRLSCDLIIFVVILLVFLYSLAVNIGVEVSVCPL
jgi:hypothetical protein